MYKFEEYLVCKMLLEKLDEVSRRLLNAKTVSVIEVLTCDFWNREGLKMGSSSLNLFIYSWIVTYHCCGLLLVPKLIVQEIKRISLTEGGGHA